MKFISFDQEISTWTRDRACPWWVLQDIPTCPPWAAQDRLWQVTCSSSRGTVKKITYKHGDCLFLLFVCFSSLHKSTLYRTPHTDEPAAHDPHQKLPDASHASRRHPGWFRLGLHRLASRPLFFFWKNKWERGEEVEARLSWKAAGGGRPPCHAEH